jgi:hypothetical protein
VQRSGTPRTPQYTPSMEPFMGDIILMIT